MRSQLFFFLLVLASVASQAQINRSAQELARDKIGQYVTGKLFAGKKYKPISFGTLRKYVSNRKTEIAWSYRHEFILHDGDEGSKEVARHSFVFYLDRRMNIRFAEDYRRY